MAFISTSALQTFCPSANDLTVAYSAGTTPVLYNRGWSIAKGGGVATKAAFNLLGGYVEFDMDVTNNRLGVNANLYSISPSISASGYTGGNYCDGQKSGSEFCVELDYIEANGHCSAASTWHTVTGWDTATSYCNQAGCGNTYGIGNSVHVKVAFNTDGSSTVTHDGVVISFANGQTQVSSGDLTRIYNAYTQKGAVIYSSQWIGWVPSTSSCSGANGSQNDLDSSSFSISNLKVVGSVVQGPSPTLCAAESTVHFSPQQNSGFCIDVVANNQTNGVPIQLYTCNQSGAQQWTWSGSAIKLAGTSKCIDVPSNSRVNGNPLQIWDCNGTGAQNWSKVWNGNYFALQLSGTNFCIDIPSANVALSQHLQLYTCNQTPAQSWSS